MRTLTVTLSLGLAGSVALYLYWRNSTQAQTYASDIVGDVIDYSTLGVAGLRNNNPGNLMWDGTVWDGLDNPMYDSKGRLRFVSMLMGLRALARDLKTGVRNGRDTIGEFIARFAPPSENNTPAYIAAVSRDTGLRSDAILDLSQDELPVLRAIITHENGALASASIPDDLILQGIQLS